MNKRKLDQLFEQAKQAHPPEPSRRFAERTLETIKNEPLQPEGEAITLADQLALLFPRLACAAILLIGLCWVVDISLSAGGGASLRDGLAQISNQWLFTAGGF